MVGRQTPFFAILVPFILVAVVDGWRGIRQAWPAALVGGTVFAVAQFATSNYISVELTDIVAALASTAAIVLLLRVWRPTPMSGTLGPLDRQPEAETRAARPAMAGGQTADAAWERDVRVRREGGDPPGRVLRAYAPYLIIIAVFAIAQWSPVKTWLEGTIKEFQWPGLDVVNPKGEAPKSATFQFTYLPAAGTLLLFCGVLTMIVLRFNPLRAARTYGAALNQLKWATLTVAAVLALAYVM